MTLVVNFFGAPGSGKSSLTGGLFYDLKTHHYINCEMAREVAKRKVWQGDHESLKDQDYISALQRRELEILLGQVDVVISDSPLLLGCIYSPSHYPDSFKQFTKWSFDQYNNLNFLVKRTKPYNPKGRNHNELESDQIHLELEKLLNGFNLPYHEVVSDSLQEASLIVRNKLRN